MLIPVALFTLACGAGGSASSDLADACVGGNGEACNTAALDLQKAGGDPARVEELLDKGCELGTEQACSNLGILLRDGTFLDQDLARARSLFTVGCVDHGHAQSCANLGMMAFEGSGGPKDLAAAEEHMNAGCEGGEAFSCNNLGLAYVQSQFGEQQLTKGLDAFLASCGLDDAQGCNVAAGMLAKGQGADPDPERAEQLRAKACELGLNDACGG